MKIAFIDDSQQKQPPRKGLGHLVSLGAAIFPEDTIGLFQSRLMELRRSIGMPDDEEIKWRPAKNTFLKDASGDVVWKFRRDMLSLAAECHVRTIVCIIDHGARYRSLDVVGVGQELLKWLFERYSMFLIGVRDTGIMIADRPGGGPKQETEFLAGTLEVTSGGTEYVEPGRIAMPVLTADSQHLPHLQLADLVVAATTAAVAGVPAGLHLKDQLRPLAHRHALGDLNGAGLVLFPDYVNLYYWALGEESWSKVGRMSGWTLPAPKLDWGTSDGLS